MKSFGFDHHDIWISWKKKVKTWNKGKEKARRKKIAYEMRDNDYVCTMSVWESD